MKIRDVTTLMLHDPDAMVYQDATIYPFKPGAKGRSALFVQIHTDEGVTGLGTTMGIPACRAVIEKNLREHLIGKDPFAIEGLWTEMFWRVRGFGRKGVAFMAISAVDIALWDLKAKALNLPLYQLLGPCAESVPAYGSGGWTHFTEKELVEEQVSYVEKGFPRVKMKVGKDFGSQEQEDIARLRAVRKAVGDDVEIFVDANNGYYAKQAINMAHAIEDLGVRWFEEPVLADDIEGLVQVAKATRIPIATGEHEYTKYGFKDLIARGGADIVQPDVGRCGGITEWMKVAHLAHAFNLPVAPHAFGLQHLHLCMCTPNLRVVEILWASHEADRVWYTEIPEPVRGQWKPLEKPGLGLDLDPDAVKRFSVN